MEYTELELLSHANAILDIEGDIRMTTNAKALN